MILEDKIAPFEKKLSEIDEIRSYYRAFHYVKKQVAAKESLTEEIIQDIHERVMPMPGIGGIYREIAVYSRGAEHVSPNPKKCANT